MRVAYRSVTLHLVGTIQIRDVPDEVHKAYRARAAASGMSLQEYLRKELEDGARMPTPSEIVAEVARERQVRGDDGYSDISSAALIPAERHSR